MQKKLSSQEKFMFTKDSTQRLICEFSQQSRNKEGGSIWINFLQIVSICNSCTLSALPDASRGPDLPRFLGTLPATFDRIRRFLALRFRIALAILLQWKWMTLHPLGNQRLNF
jgi:hypothetical protein